MQGLLAVSTIFRCLPNFLVCLCPDALGLRWTQKAFGRTHLIEGFGNCWQE